MFFIPIGISPRSEIMLKMLPNLNEIAKFRKSLGLTQTQLASMAGMSQSAVAKIERGQMAPSYDLARKLFDVLQKQLEKAKPSIVTKKVRTKTVYSIGPDSTLQIAADIMRHHDFSQLPVVKDGKNMGHVTEGTITNLILEGRNLKDLASIRVSQVMDIPLPTVDEDAPVNIVAALLQRYHAVLIVNRGEIAGIVTKSDLMKLL